MTELDGQGQWIHTNAYANGELVATYENDGKGVHFQLSDWLGTRRVQTDYSGRPELDCSGGAFGDALICTALGNNVIDATEQHFTGKERDQESGNDYFGARYYASTMGRWMSPDYSYAYDPEPVPHADLENPQTLNLYGYVTNNPLSFLDPDGHEAGCTTTATTDNNGTIHVTHTCYTASSSLMLAAAFTLENVELGPAALIGAGILGTAACIQAHCLSAIANLFSNKSGVPAPPVAAPANTANPNPENDPGKKKSSRQRMREQARRGQAPKSVQRVDPGLGPNEQDHIHFSDGSALNEDGTWKHGGRPLTNAESDWIQQNGWNTPK